MIPAKHVVGIVLSVIAERQGDWGVLVVDDGETVLQSVTCNKNAIVGPADSLHRLLGRRVRYDGTRVECLEELPTSGRFDLGSILATLGVLVAIAYSKQSVSDFLARHAAGDWGEVDDEDWKLNDQSLLSGGSLLSVYQTAKGATLHVMTKGWDHNGRRASTTILLPDED
jgi:hypothetical protein